MEKIIAYTNGRARGNPGPAAVGVQVTNEAGEVLTAVSETIGNGTDNYAAYHAVLRALQILVDLFGEETPAMVFELCIDNELVKKQLNHESQVQEPGLVPLFIEIHNVRVGNFPALTLTLVAPEKNQAAERLVNKALDR